MFCSFLQATLPECCPYPANGSEDLEKPKEDLVWIFVDSILYFIYMLVLILHNLRMHVLFVSRLHKIDDEFPKVLLFTEWEG